MSHFPIAINTGFTTLTYGLNVRCRILYFVKISYVYFVVYMFISVNSITGDRHNVYLMFNVRATSAAH